MTEFTFCCGYRCPVAECSREAPAAYQLVDHGLDAHGVELESTELEGVTREITSPARLLEAVYNISSHAKKYARLGTENYRKGKKTTAKQNSIRKDALYALKTATIRGLTVAGEADRLEAHLVDGDRFICNYFTVEGEQWSFHTPADQWDGPPVTDDPRKLDSFESDEKKERSDMSLKTALTHIQSATGLSANEYLSQEYLSYGQNSYFTGWSYLSTSDSDDTDTDTDHRDSDVSAVQTTDRSEADTDQ
jgi:hypothetical protein